MRPQDSEEQFALEVGNDNEEKAARIEAERDELVAAVADNQLDTLHRRVTWVLNYFPDARDSDITLMLRYWENFDAVDATYGIPPADLYRLTRLTSLARARAKVQNTYKLFLASPDVRKKRGQLADEEKERIAEEPVRSPAYAVYLDESGKNLNYLIIGSVWVLHPPDILRLLNSIQAWRVENKVRGEFHFKDIDSRNVNLYGAFIDFVLSHASVLSFKAIAADSRGNRHVDDTITHLLYHLLIRGVVHEDISGRAPLPRTLIVTKDSDSAGRDQVMLANVRDRLTTASAAQLDGRLTLDVFDTSSSARQPLVQIADLFAASLNRVMNIPNNEAAKDKLAYYFLERLGIPSGPSQKEAVGDIGAVILL
jgi:hypothetical protein